MQLFFRELTARRKSLIIWSVALFLFIWLSMVKYDTLATGGQATEQLVQSFPETLQAVFGMNGLNLATLEGYYGVCFLFIAVMCAIFGGMLGAGILADEETDKTTEFLYVKPITRTRILTQKALAALVQIGGITLVVWLSSIATTFKYAPSDTFMDALGLFTGAIVLLMLLFGSLGLALAATLKRPQLAVKLTAIAVVGSYFLHAFAKMMPDITWLKYLSVFSWFDAKLLLDRLSFHPWTIVASIALIIIFTVVAFITYRRRDLNV